MPNIPMLKAAGLHTFANFLSSIPEGALLDATNVIIDRDGIIEPRRGIKQYGSFGADDDVAKQLLNYKGRVLVHYGDTLAYDDGTGTFEDFDGTFSDVQEGLRIKGVELNSNFFVTTSDGIKKITATSSDLSTATISDAGGVKALDMSGTVDYSVAGFFTGLSKVAYRHVWGYYDANNNLILGAPSSSFVVTNANEFSGTVNLTFTVPAEIQSEDYFYQVYRTAVSTAATLDLLDGVDPGEEFRLVIQTNITAAEFSGSGTGVVTIDDITPDAFQQGGTPLYTNPVTGEGIAQANNKPPVAKDIAQFKNSIFFANTRTRHSMELGLLGIGSMRSGNISNITDVNPAVITSTAHGLTTGDRVVIVGTGSLTVDAEHVVTVINANTFSIPVNGTGAADTTGTWYSSYITVTNNDSPATSTRYFFVGRPEVTPVTFDTKANMTTLDGSWFNIYSAENLVHYAIWFDTTGTTTAPTVSGAFLIRVDVSDGGITTASHIAQAVQDAVEDATTDFDIVHSPAGTLTFTTANSGAATNATAGTTAPGGAFAIGTITQGFGEDLTKKYIRLSSYISEGQAVDDTARSMVKVINRNTSEVIYGDYVSYTDSVPGLMFFERRNLDNISFTISYHGFDDGFTNFNPEIGNIAEESTDEEAPNRIYFSKYQQPEAVPLVNYIDIGPKDKAILRIVPLRDSLYVFKEDGIYRITGDISPAFSVILFDNSVTLMAPDSAAILNNQVYCLTDGGIATVTETGVGIVSRPIENIFTRINTPNYPNFSKASFGIGYETDRAYFIWTVTEENDTQATQCFRYNTFTRCWTRWDKAQTCAVVNSDDNKLYFGSADFNEVDVERKDLVRTDFADRQSDNSIPNLAILDDDTLMLSSVTDEDVGDAIVQTQYLTINQFNNLLKKLDLDPRSTPAPTQHDYFETLGMVAGDNLTSKMNDLVAKLNSDNISSIFVFDGTTDFESIQTQFNTIVDQLNDDQFIKFTNYQYSTGTLDVEMTIESVNTSANTVTGSIPGFMVGPVITYKGIYTTIVWAPINMTDPVMLKHVRESTVLFENTDFRGAELAFNTDLSPGYEAVPFVMEGSGVWGSFDWGESSWGGSGSAVPFRTYIPRQKQRCRFIRSRFKHNDAFYRFAILGISYVFEMNSERAYRGVRN